MIYISSFTINAIKNGARQEECFIGGYIYGNFGGSAYQKQKLKKYVLYFKMINKWNLLVLFLNPQCTSTPYSLWEPVKRTTEIIDHVP